MNRKLRIGVIGGGIGGAALTASLQQRGMEAHLFERTAAYKEVGAGVQMTPNAVKILKALGLGDELQRLGYLPQAIVGRNWRTGREKFRTPLSDACPQLFGAEFYHLHRADLLAMLVGLVDPRHITHNARCMAVLNQDEAAVARFDDGQEFEADVIVGADGVHSVVRDALFGGDAPRFTGHICWRASIPLGERPDFISPVSAVWLGPNGHVVTYAISGGRLLNIVAVSEAADWQESSWHLPSNRDELMRTFSGWHPELLRILSCAQNVLKWGLFDRDPMRHWSRGRITLLGDAAHPMLPFLAQGAAMAMEDGYVLACVLAANAGDIPEALRLYEAERLPRTSRVQLTARERGKIYHLPTPWQQFRRDFSYKLKAMMNPNASGLEANWVFSYDATAFRPPDGAATRGEPSEETRPIPG
ncbi:FAD-dependent monooxygenase [Acerihabitans arboris]|uniref:Salicylate 1-monooxygenase n=1 Tax=Acerihabitans arboris TaxID=2691583 RepID=A0A845SDU4_9GAMM|nr:FAD-dependent monooxygenase [Acerihabitans arboris]NDL61572.1 salicylate 1-monooxygenase [Acerihabitans arboris]